MSLTRLIDEKELTILGLNSGTSSDGVDLAAVRISDAGGKRIEFIDGVCVPYPNQLRQTVLKMCDSARVVLDELIYLDNLLGVFFGETAEGYMRRLLKRGVVVDAIASHGQTVRHLPRKTKYLTQKVHGTLQIGSLEIIAALTGTTVVGDFRQADIALGNEGAPITVHAMARLFGHSRQSRLIVNVGGMANYFYFPPGSDPSVILAADTGPGNVLSDLLCQHLFKQKYDRDGSHAKRGSVSERLYRSVFRRASRSQSRSTGREQFGEQIAGELIKRGNALGLSKNDIMATALEGTIRAIHERVRPILAYDSTLDKLYLTGGGVHNSFLVERLRQALLPCRVLSVSELGYDPDLVEATAYAVMGSMCLRSEPTMTQFSSRAAGMFLPVCGMIVQPPIKTVRSK